MPRKKMTMRYTMEQLKEFQAMPLERKVGLTCARITEFYTHYEGKVFVSFSGGKDSTVLLHIARKLFPDITALFLNTGLEYPEIVNFVKTFDNIDIRRPSVSFKKVLETEGYPVISKEMSQYIREYRSWVERQQTGDGGGYPQVADNGMERGSGRRGGGVLSKPPTRLCSRPNGNYPPPHMENPICQEATSTTSVIPPEQTLPYNKFRYEMCKKWAWVLDAPFRISDKCCGIMKKDVSKAYQAETGRHPIIGTLAAESLLRRISWLKNGCNAFDATEPKSTPMAFWTEQDVLSYIKRMGILISPIYGDIVEGRDGKLKTTGAQRTGCMYCLFGIHHEKQPNRIQRLYYSHPKIYNYILDKLGFREVMDFMKIPYEPVIDKQLMMDFGEERTDDQL